MARIEIQMMKRIHKNNAKLHDLATATYDVYEIAGRKILQIDTYGRPDREYSNQASQSIQLDEKNVKALFDLLKKHYTL